jgi:hypothetical protein
MYYHEFKEARSRFEILPSQAFFAGAPIPVPGTSFGTGGYIQSFG